MKMKRRTFLAGLLSSAAVAPLAAQGMPLGTGGVAKSAPILVGDQAIRLPVIYGGNLIGNLVLARNALNRSVVVCGSIVWNVQESALQDLIGDLQFEVRRTIRHPSKLNLPQVPA